MTRTVAITGSSGFVGKWLVQALLAIDGFAVTKVLRPANAVERGRQTRQEQVAIVTDGTSSSAWKQADLQRVDVLVHLAAYTAKSTVEVDDVAANLIGNAIFTQRLLTALPEAPSRIVYASAIDVYRPQPPGVLLTEESPIGPSSVYGASKYFAESVVRAYCRTRGADLLIARVGHLYGPGEAEYRKLVPAAIRAAVAGQAPEVIGDPEARRDLLYVGDAVEALTRMVDLNCDPEEIINLASGRSSSVLEILSLIAELAGSPPPRFSPEPKVASRSVEVDVSRMRNRLGEWPMVSLTTGLRAEIASYGRLT